MTRHGLAWGTGLALSLAVGCAAEVGDEEVALAEDELYGTVTLLGTGPDACTLAEGVALMETMTAGRRIAATPEFAASLRQELATEYLPCSGTYCLESGHCDVLYDPYWSSSATVRYQRALDVMRGGATITLGCRPGGPPGQANSIDTYGNPAELVFVGREYLAGNMESGLSDEELGGISGVIWHEAMHQQGYADCDSDGDGEGYSSSLPARAQRAMTDAALLGRAVLIDDATRALHSIPLGVSTGPAGHFGPVGDDAATTIRLGPAMRATVCTNADGTGTCSTIVNATLEAGWHTGLGALSGQVSYVRLEPLALAFSGTDYTGTVQAFAYGEVLASGLGTVGNDATRSLYVPPGVRVRACGSEGAGHGSGCVVYDAPSPSVSIAGGVSYLDVVPVVTAFGAARFYGGRTSMSPGTWSGALGLGAVASGVRSIVVPPGLSARLCSGSVCQTHVRSSFDVSSVPTRIEVQPVTSPRVLTIQRAGITGVGTVTTAPDGVASCGSSTCSASFHDRSYVRVRAASTGAYVVSWSGCDVVSGDTCSLSMTSARTVTLRLDEPPCSVSACVSACVAEGFRHAQCLPLCRRNPCAF